MIPLSCLKYQNWIINSQCEFSISKHHNFLEAQNTRWKYKNITHSFIIISIHTCILLLLVSHKKMTSIFLDNPLVKYKPCIPEFLKGVKNTRVMMEIMDSKMMTEFLLSGLKHSGGNSQGYPCPNSWNL